ncbi:MAG: hypothetical protein J3R72DRAFT_155330 [Linnemannia gamsii]|nr:MAG: hypothetical protein J3R72DRAFT_155330 [Linnemannia gamsii]
MSFPSLLRLHVAVSFPPLACSLTFLLPFFSFFSSSVTQEIIPETRAPSNLAPSCFPPSSSASLTALPPSSS